MKQNPLVSYITKLTFFSIGISFISLFLLIFLSKEYIPNNTPYYIAFYYIITIAGYFIIYLVSTKGKMNFVNIFMIVKLVKYILCALVFVIVVLITQEKAIPFTILYLILFLMYHIFDTISLNKLSKRIK